MKFRYCYRTKDNVEHWDDVVAADRDAAYAALRSQGIRPGRVIEAPGFFNKLMGKGKRWIAISLLGVLCVGLSVVVLRLRNETVREQTLPDTLPRSQIYGDPWVIKQMRQNDFAGVFVDEGDRFLARFAVPGRAVASAGVPQSVSVKPVKIAAGDLVEIATLKRIVNGMKAELAQYLADGGSLEKYERRLRIRQLAEVQIVEESAKLLKNEARPNVWKEVNLKLRNMGLPMIVENVTE